MSDQSVFSTDCKSPLVVKGVKISSRFPDELELTRDCILLLTPRQRSLVDLMSCENCMFDVKLVAQCWSAPAIGRALNQILHELIDGHSGIAVTDDNGTVEVAADWIGVFGEFGD